MTKRDIRRSQRLAEPDREGWAEGPWDHEPDLVEWRANATQFALLIVRGPMGSLCGYVGLPPGHPLHGKSWEDFQTEHGHGGLTYSGACRGDICHVPAPGEPDDVWWLGFDCAHAWDVSPGLESRTGLRRRDELTAYRDIDYVMDEVERLAAELAGIAQPVESDNGSV